MFMKMFAEANQVEGEDGEMSIVRDKGYSLSHSPILKMTRTTTTTTTCRPPRHYQMTKLVPQSYC